jgi:hypothetical protein
MHRFQKRSAPQLGGNHFAQTSVPYGNHWKYFFQNFIYITYFDNTQQHKKNGPSLWGTLVHRRNNITGETLATTTKEKKFPSKPHFLSFMMTISITE